MPVGKSMTSSKSKQHSPNLRWGTDMYKNNFSDHASASRTNQNEGSESKGNNFEASLMSRGGNICINDYLTRER